MDKIRATVSNPAGVLNYLTGSVRAGQKEPEIGSWEVTKEQVADKLQGCIAVAVKVPDALFQEAGPQIAASWKTLAASESRLLKTQQVIEALPTLLGSLDQHFDQALKSAHVISQAAEFARKDRAPR